ncbi:MAG: Ig-like domain repeat protein [Solirubrobacterales bacterium]
MIAARRVLTLLIVCVAVGHLAAITQADPLTYVYKPCGDSDGGATPTAEWDDRSNYIFHRVSSCIGTWALPISLAGYGDDVASSSLPLRSAPTLAVNLTATGHDRSSEGVHMDFAVCSGPKFPDDCGTVISGANLGEDATEVALTRENGGVPDRADRLVLHSVCRDASFLNPCTPTDDDPKFADVRVTQEDRLPPVIGDFEPPPDQWLRAFPDTEIPVHDGESGVFSVTLAKYSMTWTDEACSVQQLARACPSDFLGTSISRRGFVQQGYNVVGVTASDAVGQTTSRRVTFLYDSVRPRPPVDIHLDNPSGWAIGTRAVLHWTNDGESEPTSNASGIASAEVELESPSGWSYSTNLKTVSGVGIDSAPIELPEEGRWTARVQLTDAAGNTGSPSTYLFQSEEHGPNAPLVSAIPPIGIAQAAAGATIEWAGTVGAASGLCGYRGWVGRGNPPDLASDPSTTLPGGISRSFQLTPSGLMNLKDGVNTFAVAAVDCAGAVSATSARPLIVDRVAPAAVLNTEADWVGSSTGVSVSAADRGDAAARSGVARTWYRVGAAPRVTVDGASAQLPALSEGTHVVQFGAVDAAGNPSPDAQRTIGVDETSPTAVISPVPGDLGSFVASVVDGVSGVAGAQAELVAADGTELPVGDRVIHQTDAPGQVQLPIRIPTGLADGDYILRVHASDAAGNVTVAVRSIHLPVRPRPTLSAAIASVAKPGAMKQEITLGIGAKARLTGILRAADGRPIAGAPLRVLVTRISGERRILASVATAADGSYSVPLGSDVSRTITVSFPGDATHEPVAARVVENVRAGVAIKLSAKRVRRGAPVYITGGVRLLSAVVPENGVSYRVDYCDPGGRCKKFGYYGHTDYAGGIGMQIGTRGLRRGTWRLRATVEAAPGWPFAEGSSKIVKLIVR